MLFLSLINLTYLISQQPFESQFANRIEIFNELTVLGISEMTTTLLNRSCTPLFKNEVGWVIIAIATFNIFINIAIVAVSSCTDLFKESKDYYHDYHKMARR